MGLILTLNVLGSLANRTAPLEDWRIDQQHRYATLTARKDQIEAVTLGNSHADSIDYSVLGLDGQSLALAAADLFELERYAAFLSNELPKLKTVFITISYYSFSRDNAVFESLRSRRIGFYSMLPIWNPISGDLMNFLLGKVDSYTHVMSVARSDSWQGVWMELPNSPAPGEPFPYDGIRTVSEWGECLHYSAEMLDTHAQEIARRNVVSSRQMAHAHPGLAQDSYEALARTIARLQVRGIRVILFTPAYYEKYNSYFADQGSDLIELMRREIGELQQVYPVAYYDFSHDPELTPYPELFYNSDHVGECGQKVLSAKLLTMLRDQ